MNPFTESMFVLFAILTLGAWIGQWSWRGISLGTAGVLFAWKGQLEFLFSEM
ncbi:MAG: hypothetical protein H7Y59_18380 [Anaerolineales bacterium]|nr:hypothetical protein [Anaerolineales bacterium]